jgi:hypothetical protein
LGAQVWRFQRGDYMLGFLNLFIIPVQWCDLPFIAHRASGVVSVIYSLIISGLKYIKLGDPTELPKSIVDSGFIILPMACPIGIA